MRKVCALAQGETVLDVPATLAARVRVFDTGNARKTDAVDAHAVAMVALRTPRLTRRHGRHPSPDHEVFVRRIAGVPLSQAFYRADDLHRNTIYVAGEVAAAQWRQLPPKARSLVKHP